MALKIKAIHQVLGRGRKYFLFSTSSGLNSEFIVSTLSEHSLKVSDLQAVWQKYSIGFIIITQDISRLFP